jgi:hypothetical protein
MASAIGRLVVARVSRVTVVGTFAWGQGTRLSHASIFRLIGITNIWFCSCSVQHHSLCVALPKKRTKTMELCRNQVCAARTHPLCNLLACSKPNQCAEITKLFLDLDSSLAAPTVSDLPIKVMTLVAG